MCVCVSPWFWEAPAVLVITRALRGSSSAQAMGNLSDFKAEALWQLSFLGQHNAVNNQGICAAQETHNKVPSTELLRSTAAA